MPETGSIFAADLAKRDEVYGDVATDVAADVNAAVSIYRRNMHGTGWRAEGFEPRHSVRSYADDATARDFELNDQRRQSAGLHDGNGGAKRDPSVKINNVVI